MEKEKELSSVDRKIIELRVLGELIDFIDIKIKKTECKISDSYCSEYDEDDRLVEWYSENLLEMKERIYSFRRFKGILENYI